MNTEESYRAYPKILLVNLKVEADKHIGDLIDKKILSNLSDREKFELEAWSHIRNRLMEYISQSRDP